MASLTELEPRPGSARLVIEVSGDSLRKDRFVKGAIYPRAGIPEYWIVNIVEESIEVHLDPDPTLAAYKTRSSVGRGQELRCQSVPEIVFPVDAVFG